MLIEKIKSSFYNTYNKPMNFAQKYLKNYSKELSQHGFTFFLNARIKKINRYISFTRKVLKKNQVFIFENELLHYFYHPYNSTWDNERTIEISLGLFMLNKYRNKNILEVGNVLSHYIHIQHKVVDKYEIAKGVINKDIAFYQTNRKFDLIISLSTIEHVGRDEIPYQPKKAIDAIRNIYKLLKPNGVFFFTVPIGYNNEIDKAIFENKIQNCNIEIFKRFSEENEWKTARVKDIKNVKYGYPFIEGNAIAIGFIKKH